MSHKPVGLRILLHIYCAKIVLMTGLKSADLASHSTQDSDIAERKFPKTIFVFLY